MRVVDISREMFSSELYPEDPAPTLELLQSADDGGYTVSGLHFCLHTGTHVEFPLHCIKNGSDAGAVALDPFVGDCHVVSFQGAIEAEHIEKFVSSVCKRLIIKGNGSAYLTQSGAKTLAGRGVLLIGTDSMSIGSGGDEFSVHVALLSAGVPIMEGLDLSMALDGKYFLVAAPVKIAKAEASPVRALLIDTF